MAHCVTPDEYETLRPLLRQITEQLVQLQRLGEHAADAAVAPVLQRVCAPRPMELLGQLREMAGLFNEILLQETVDGSVTVEAPADLSVLLTMGDDTLLNGLLANLVSNSLAAGTPAGSPSPAHRGSSATGMTARDCPKMRWHCWRAVPGANACWNRAGWACR